MNIPSCLSCLLTRVWCCGGACIARPLLACSLCFIFICLVRLGFTNASYLLTDDDRWRRPLLQLQREWNSRSCTNVNRIGRTPVPTSTSGNTTATLCRPARDGTQTPPPVLEPPNTSTLPYIRNFYKNSTVTPNLPKSASTWGPLHKPLHWKVRSTPRSRQTPLSCF